MKIEIEIVCKVLYEVNEEYYPKNSTNQDILNIDIQNAKDDPFSFIEMSNSKMYVSGKIIES